MYVFVFQAESQKDLDRKIMQEKPKMPQHASPNAHSLLKVKVDAMHRRIFPFSPSSPLFSNLYSFFRISFVSIRIYLSPDFLLHYRFLISVHMPNIFAHSGTTGKRYVKAPWGNESNDVCHRRGGTAEAARFLLRNRFQCTLPKRDHSAY